MYSVKKVEEKWSMCMSRTCHFGRRRSSFNTETVGSTLDVKIVTFPRKLKDISLRTLKHADIFGFG